MNEFSKELMHMTDAEKRAYNREYYRKNREYWKNYAETGHGIGRQSSNGLGTPGASGRPKTYGSPTTGGYRRGEGLNASKSDFGTPGASGRPKTYGGPTTGGYRRGEGLNASQKKAGRLNRESLDNITMKKNMQKQNYVYSMKSDAENLRRYGRAALYRGDVEQARQYADTAKDYERRIEMARGDLIRKLALENPASKYRSNTGPRTANVEKTVGLKLKSALTRSIRHIKSGSDKAVKFVKSFF